MRVIVDHREGFAYAGTLDEGVVLEALAEARDNATFGEPDECNGLADARRGRGPRPRPVAARASSACPPPTRWRWPSSSSGPPSAATRGSPACARPCAATRGARARSPPARASAPGAGPARCHLAVQALAVHDGETQIAGGLSVGREVADLDVEEAAADAVLRATRLLGSTKPPTQRVTLVLEPRLTATILGIVGGMLNGGAVIKGRSPFADRVGEQIASPLPHLRRRPHRPPLARRRHPRRRGPGPPPQRARGRRRAPGLPPQHLHGPPVGHGLHRLGRAGVLLHARRRGPGAGGGSRAPAPTRSCSPRSTSACSSRRWPASTPGSTRCRATSPWASRA